MNLKKACAALVCMVVVTQVSMAQVSLKNIQKCKELKHTAALTFPIEVVLWEVELSEYELAYSAYVTQAGRLLAQYHECDFLPESRLGDCSNEKGQKLKFEKTALGVSAIYQDQNGESISAFCQKNKNKQGDVQ